MYKELFINNDNLSDNEIDRVENRVKALLINSNNEILVGYQYNAYQFIGGHVESDEEFRAALNREIKEESGIEIDVGDIKPFFHRQVYSKNHLNKGYNCDSNIYYFKIYTDLKPNLNNTNYTAEEIIGNFKLEYIPIDELLDKVIDNKEKYGDVGGIASEVISMLEETYSYVKKRTL